MIGFARANRNRIPPRLQRPHGRLGRL